MKNLMQKLHKYLIYSNPLLETEDSDESGPIEAVKSSICEILELYTQRYEDVFGPVLPDFVQTTLQLLTSFGQDSKYDLVVSRAFSFLTSVAKIQRQVDMFSEDQVLAKIVQQIVLPNMALRTSDEELFEDDPMEFTRRDLEGSDSDTRRRSATDFIRELTDKLESKVTNVVMTYVRGYLDTYKSDPAHNWRAKDCAIYLFSAIAAKGNVTNAGVTTTNLLIDVVGFFA
jgi:exportin-2 (importin alpha re-exporter)